MSFISQIKSRIAAGERAALNAVYPDEIEYYSVALELTNIDGEIVDYLVFPVNPSNITYQHSPLVNIKKTSRAIVTLFNDSFQPKNITISGNFGKQFRFLIGSQSISGAAFRLSLKNNPQLNTQIKSGYGVLKVMKSIFEKSLQVDNQGRPYKLFFHNLIMGSSNLIEVVNINIQISEQRNMLFDYSATFRAIADSKDVSNTPTKTSSVLVMSTNEIQKGVLNITSRLREVI